MSDSIPPPDDRPAAGVPAGPHVPVVKLTTVPVYNCRVYLHGPAADGTVTARCANLPNMSVTAASERDALKQIVSDFKVALRHFQTAGQAIPWIEPPEPINPGERQRLIGVHM